MTKKWNRFLLPILTVALLVALLGICSIAAASQVDPTAVNYSGTYDGQTHSGGVNNLPEGGYALYSWGDDHSSEPNAPSVRNVGEYIGYTAEIFDDTGTPILSVDGVLNVTGPKEVTVSWQGDSFTYNGSPQGPTASLPDGSIIGEDAVQLSVSGNANTDVNSYTASASLTGTAAGNYTIVSGATQSYSIGQKSVSITWNVAQSYTFNGSPQGPTASCSEIAAADQGSVSVVPANNQNTNAGTYTATASLNGAKAGNYSVTSGTSQEYTIQPQGVTLTANDYTGAALYYTGSEQTVTTSVTCSVNGVTFSGAGASGSGTTATSHSINVTGVTINQTRDTSGNYIVTATEAGSFTINKAVFTVTANGNSTTKTYNGAEQTFDGTVTGTSTSTVFDASKFSYSGSLQVKGTAAKDTAYTTAIDTTKCSYSDTDNCTVTFAVGTPISMTINKIANIDITVTGNTDTKTYNASEQSVSGYQLNCTTTGFTFDQSKVSTVTAVAKGTNVVGSPYMMNLSASQFSYNDASVTNATFHVTDGSLTIIQAPAAQLGLSVQSYNAVYDASAHGVTATVTVTEGTTISYSNDNKSTWSTTNPTYTNVAGTPATVYVKAENSNYITAESSGTVTITRASLTITAKPQTYTYNLAEQGPAGTYTSNFDTYVTVTGLKGNDALTSITLSGKKKNANTYTNEIVPSAAIIGTVTDNYDITSTSYVANTLTIKKVPITVTPRSGMTKVFDTDDPNFNSFSTTATESAYTLSFTSTPDPDPGKQPNDYQAEFASKHTLGRTYETDTISGTTVGEGQKAGTYEITLKPMGDQNLDITFVTGVEFTITRRTVTYTKTAQNKNYGVVDPTITYTVDPGENPNSTVATYEAWLHTAELKRVEGEAVGDYSYNFEVIADATTASLDIIKTDGDGWTVAADGTVTGTAPVFTIHPVFVGDAGKLTFNNTIMTSRTNHLDFTVAGIQNGVDLSNAKATLKLADIDTSKTDISTVSFATNADYTLSVTPKLVTDSTSQKKYYSYLPVGTYHAKLMLPTVEGTPVEATNIDVAVTVKPDSIPTLSIFNNNDQNERRDLYGEETKDTISFLMEGKFATETRAWTAGSDQEILKLEYVVDGDSVSELNKYIEISKIDKYQIDSELHDYLNKYAASRGLQFNKVAFTITATIVTPGMTPTSVSHDYNYDYQMLPLTDERIVNLDNRAFSFVVELPEPAKINKIAISGFNPIDPETIKYESSDSKYATALLDGYGLTATVPLSYSTAALPISSQCVLEIEMEDYAGNKRTYTMNGIPMAVSNGIGIIRIEPQAYFGKGEGYSIRETNVIRMSGMGTGFETMSINLATTTGWRRSWTLTIPASDQIWSPNMDDYWEFAIGNRRSDESLRQQLDFPSGIPVEVTLSYQDVVSGGYRTILLYDENVQEPVILTPAFPGMRIMMGYTEPLSTVILSWSGGSKQAYVTPWGLFMLELPEGIIDPEITLEITDVAGNTLTKKITVPGRKSEVDMVCDAYPMGALIQDDTGMISGVATPVAVADLDDGPVKLPILVADYFKVGTLTLTKGSDGTVTFNPVIDPEYAVEGAGTFFKVFTKKPTAEQVDKATRGVGLDYKAGYTVAEGTEVIWFAFETQATLTEDQMTLSNNPAIVNPSVDAEFNRLQTVGN